MVDGEDVAMVSFDDIRWSGGENGYDSFVSFGDWCGEELADRPRAGDAGVWGDPASLLVGICAPDRRRGDIVFRGEGGPRRGGALLKETARGVAILWGGEWVPLGLCTVGGEYVRGDPSVCGDRIPGDIPLAGKGNVGIDD